MKFKELHLSSQTLECLTELHTHRTGAKYQERFWDFLQRPDILVGKNGTSIKPGMGGWSGFAPEAITNLRP